MDPILQTAAAPRLRPLGPLSPEVLGAFHSGNTLTGELLETDGPAAILCVGDHRIPVEGPVDLPVGKPFELVLDVVGRDFGLKVVPPASAGETDLLLALRERMFSDLPAGQPIDELVVALRASLTGGSRDAAAMRLLNQLAEHAFQPGSNGYVLRDLVTRSGLGFEAALAHASDFMLEGDLQPPPHRTLAAAMVRALGIEATVRPETARQLEEMLVRELGAMRAEGVADIGEATRRLGKVMVQVLLKRSAVALRDTLLARADTLASGGELPERENALLRVWLGQPTGVSERIVTLWLAQAVLTPWLRDLKARLLAAERELEGKARVAVQRALAVLEREQLLNLARAQCGQGWLASFSIPDADVPGVWTTAHLLHRASGGEEQHFVLGVDFGKIGPVRAEFTGTSQAVRLRVVVGRSETAGVLRRRLVEMHSLFEGAEADVELSLTQSGDASVETLLGDVRFLREHPLHLLPPRNSMQGGADASPASESGLHVSGRTAPVNEALGTSITSRAMRGSGTAVDRLLALARKEGIPMRSDRTLLALLARSVVGEEMPVELYEVVASLLTYLHSLNGELAAKG